MRQKYHFMAGKRRMQAVASSLLDAWLAIEIKTHSSKKPIASEFRERPIEAYDQAGKLLATRTWEEWHAELMRDTYGENWRDVVARSSVLV